MKSLARLSLLAVFAGSLFAFSTDASASRFGGAAIHTDRVMAGSTDSYVETFTAGQAYWEVKGDGDTDLDCFVVENGRVVASDEDNDDHCVVMFTAMRATTVTLVIKNYGTVYNEYTTLVR